MKGDISNQIEKETQEQEQQLTATKPAGVDANDQQMKDYLEQSKQWIQGNARDSKEAWEMFWGAYKQQQQAIGQWNEEQSQHHQSVSKLFSSQKILINLNFLRLPIGGLVKRSTLLKKKPPSKTSKSSKKLLKNGRQMTLLK